MHGQLRGGPAGILALLAILVVAGCGSGTTETVAQAKQKMVDSCHSGHAGDAADLRLCRCMVARLASEQHFTRATQFEATLKTVESGKQPAILLAASTSCARSGITASG